MEFKDQNGQPFVATDADHLYTQFNDTFFHPPIPTVWNQKYAEQIARFVLKRSRVGDPNTNDAIARLVLAGKDFTKSFDNIIVLEKLHAAETSARKVSPFTFQRILWMQEGLYNSGVETKDTLEQRSVLIEMLNLDPNGHEEMRDIGRKVCGLELCCEQVVKISQFDKNLGESLLKIITDKFGDSLYNSYLMTNRGYRLQDNSLQQSGVSETRRIMNLTSDEINTFLIGLPHDKLKQFGKVELKSVVNILKHDLQRKIATLKGK